MNLKIDMSSHWYYWNFRSGIALALFAVVSLASGRSILAQTVAAVDSPVSINRLNLVERLPMKPFGHYKISVHHKGGWKAAGALDADMFLRTKTLDLSPWADGKTIRLRIRPIGGSNAHLDRLVLDGWAPVNLAPEGA